MSNVTRQTVKDVEATDQWQEMSPRQKDAFAQEFIFKRPVKWFPCWRDAEDGVWYVKSKDHDPKLDDGDEITEPCYWPEEQDDSYKDDPIYWEVVPNYSTDLSCDNKILKKVYKAWTGHKLDCFWMRLKELLGRRWQADHGNKAWTDILSLMQYYHAGDYVHASWLTLNGD